MDNSISLHPLIGRTEEETEDERIRHFNSRFRLGSQQILKKKEIFLNELKFEIMPILTSLSEIARYLLLSSVCLILSLWAELHLSTVSDQ